ncbi:hypothetical protein ACH068_001533 [Shigella flexneri]
MNELTTQELLEQRRKINKELQARALTELQQVARLYNAAYGDDKGVFELGEQLCKIVAIEMLGNDGWANLVAHLRKISG